MNALSLKRQEGLNIEKAMATMVGAPLQEILRIEKESIKETFLQYKNAEERYKTDLELAKKGKISQEALLESQNNMKKMQQKAYSEILGAQRSVMEQMFGRLVGTFKGQAGFAGASMYSKYGAGLSVNAQGQVMSFGSENLNAHNSYGERILGNQLSALGGGKQVSSKKDEKTVDAIKQMANINKTTNDLVSKILEKMNKEKTEAKSKDEKEKKEAEAQKGKDAVTKEFLKGQFDRIPGIKKEGEKDKEAKGIKYDQDIKDKNQQIKAELKRDLAKASTASTNGLLAMGGKSVASEKGLDVATEKSSDINMLKAMQIARKNNLPLTVEDAKKRVEEIKKRPELQKIRDEEADSMLPSFLPRFLLGKNTTADSLANSNLNDRAWNIYLQELKETKPLNQTAVAPIQRNIISNSSQQNNLNNRIASNNAQTQNVQVTVKIDASDKMKQIAKIEPKELVTDKNIVAKNQQANMRQIG
jgi:hypothetical protein